MPHENDTAERYEGHRLNRVGLSGVSFTTILRS